MIYDKIIILRGYLERLVNIEFRERVLVNIKSRYSLMGGWHSAGAKVTKCHVC